MVIKPHRGFMDREIGVSGAIAATILADRFLKEDDSPVTLSEISEATLLSGSEIRELIELLCSKGIVKLGSGEIAGAGSFRITGLRVCIEADQRTLAGMDEAPKANDLAAPKPARFDSGRDEVDSGGCRYFGEVEYDGENSGGRYQLLIKRQSIERPEESGDVFYGDFADKPEAWRFFDNFVSKDSREETGEMDFEDAEGTKWTATVEPEGGDDENSNPEPRAILTITRLFAGDATSTTVVEDAFDTDRLAWDYADEYLKPVENSEAPALEVVDGGDRKPTITAETDGVKWRYFGQDGKKKGSVDRFEFDLPGGTESKEIPSKEVLADGRSIEEIAESIMEEFTREPVA